MAVTTPRGAAVVLGACYAQLLGATRCASTLSAKYHRHQADASGSRSPRPAKSAKPLASPRGAAVARMLSPDVSKFMRSRDGHLATTLENARFLREHPTVDHDHGTMIRLEAAAGDPAAAAAIRRLSQTYGVRLAWSPRHVIHPHRLRFLDPRGHPLAAKIRSDCARRDREHPLWAFATATGGVSAVVWQLTKRELLRAVFQRLATRGYDEHGRREVDGTEIRGTLWLMLWRPQHARRLPVDEFGEVVADVLDKHYATRLGSSAADELEPKGRGRTEKGKGGDGESLAGDTTRWKPRERFEERGRRVRTPAAEPDGQITWQPRQRK